MADVLVVEAAGSMYLRADITAPWNPATDVIDGCLLAFNSADPVEADWKAASWTPGMTATARLLYGSAGVTGQLVPGAYWLRFRVHDNPEVPVLKAAIVVLT